LDGLPCIREKERKSVLVLDSQSGVGSQSELLSASGQRVFGSAAMEMLPQVLPPSRLLFMAIDLKGFHS
jgi:hypothetical protein